MDTTFEKIGDVLKVTISGRLVAAFSEHLKEDLAAKIAENHAILLDLSQMSYVDSSGLGVLVSSLQKATESGCVLKLACLQPRPRIVFDITKVYRIFDIYDTVPAALASFYKDGTKPAAPAAGTPPPSATAADISSAPTKEI